MAQISQGSTPTHKFHLSLSSDMIESAIVTYAQHDKTVFEKQGDDVAIGDNCITVELTQEDTLALDPNESVRVQIKVKTMNGKVIPSKMLYLTTNEVLNKEVM